MVFNTIIHNIDEIYFKLLISNIKEGNIESNYKHFFLSKKME